MWVAGHAGVSLWPESRERCSISFRKGTGGRLIVRLWIALVSLLMLGASAPALDGLASIRGDDMRRHVEFLAADELAGRETGEPLIAIAERYVATAFASYGLERLPGHDDFAVPFTLYRRGYDRDATGVRTADAGCRAGRDCKPFPFSAAGEVEASVVFAGYGIRAPSQGWDDYDGLDVKGKLVLVLRHGPGEADSSKTVAGDHQQFTVKAQKAEAFAGDPEQIEADCNDLLAASLPSEAL